MLLIKDKSGEKVMFLTILCVIIDQWTKIIISSCLNLNGSIPIIKNLFNLTYVQNKGAAFSIFQNQRILLIGVTIVVIIALLYNLSNDNNINKTEEIAYGLCLGGTIGNLVDRLLYGYVIDFVDIKIFSYNFPVFNFADAMLVIGAIIFCICIVRREKHARESN